MASPLFLGIGYANLEARFQVLQKLLTDDAKLGKLGSSAGLCEFSS
jgi:hypothetical protein